ncbi:MAG: divergent PAP2 family protein [Vampirovibrionales bacterium]|nr:divergent PAP2 family protein [Vampirovibrionales bacterium]
MAEPLSTPAAIGPGVEVLLSSASAALMAQLFKFFWYLAIGRSINFRILVQTGGMPSSHSASMVALATSVGLLDGFNSTIFAVAAGIAMIVMYDAAGLRQAAGKMAGILNKITEDIYSSHPDQVPYRLRELLGHTPFEVLVGALLGIVTAYGYYGYIHT